MRDLGVIGKVAAVRRGLLVVLVCGLLALGAVAGGLVYDVARVGCCD